VLSSKLVKGLGIGKIGTIIHFLVQKGVRYKKSGPKVVQYRKVFGTNTGTYNFRL
jgi:hypothetical protein